MNGVLLIKKIPRRLKPSINKIAYRNAGSAAPPKIRLSVEFSADYDAPFQTTVYFGISSRSSRSVCMKGSC
jgi:hypothetical protein